MPCAMRATLHYLNPHTLLVFQRGSSACLRRGRATTRGCSRTVNSAHSAARVAQGSMMRTAPPSSAAEGTPRSDQAKTTSLLKHCACICVLARTGSQE